MRLKQQVERLELRTAQMSKRELCPHLPAEIHYPDGSFEGEVLHEHNCGKPRLRIMVSYSDGSDRRTQDAAIEAFNDIRRECRELPPEECAKIVAERFPLLPETRAALRERVSRDS